MHRENIIRIVTDISDEKDMAVGLKLVENTVYVMFPHGYRLSNRRKGINHDIIKLIKMFEKFNTRRNSKILIDNAINHQDGFGITSFPFTSVIWLINDYQRNGLLTKVDRTTELTKRGSINWKQTIKYMFPLSVDEDAIYNEYFTTRINSVNTLLTEIHRYAIGRSLDVLGWLYPAIKFEAEYKLPSSKTSCIKILKQEMGRNNNDRIKHTINHMLKLLMYDDGQDMSRILFENLYTENFEYIWEDLIFYSLNNVDIEDYYPSAFWVIQENELKTSSLRPDTILNKNNSTIIVDAKYYKYGFSGKYIDLPQTTDIVKQIAYRHFLEERKPGIYRNCFVLPKNIEYKSIEYFGYSNYTHNKEDNIFGLFVDTTDVIDSYLHLKTINFKSKLATIFSN